MRTFVISIIFNCLLTFSLFGKEGDDPSKWIKDQQAFAFSLYPLLADDGNCVFSPYSIATSLAMVYVGARGETASQMQTSLHFSLDRKKMGTAALQVSSSLALKKEEEGAYQLRLANALWVDQNLFLLTDFRYAIEQAFKAKLGAINFSQTKEALTTINNWTAEQTQGHIPQIVNEGDINTLTQLVLTNAVYFQGKWIHPFDPKATVNGSFYPTPETKSVVKMMTQTSTCLYYENELVQAVALPFIGTSYSGGNLAFIAVLPKSAENFFAMIDELPQSFGTWLSSLAPAYLSLKMPRFNLDKRYSLNDPLKQLGMEDAFESNANFAGIDGLRDLALQKAIHQTFFALDENGVVAAAATEASMQMKSSAPKDELIVMTLDHPFVFFLIDLNSQEMVFMGKIANPSLVQ